jgi:hypothetical protein
MQLHRHYTHIYIYIYIYIFTHAVLRMYIDNCITQLYVIVFPPAIAQAKPESSTNFFSCRMWDVTRVMTCKLQQSVNLHNGASALIVLLHPSTQTIVTNVRFFKYVSRHAAAIALSISSLNWHQSVPPLVLYKAHACLPLIRSRDMSCFLPSYWDNSR